MEERIPSVGGCRGMMGDVGGTMKRTDFEP